VEAASGPEAWDTLQRENVRMLVAGWMMPGLDCRELVRRIRSANWPRYTYIILLAAKNGRDDVVEGLNTGADDCVARPFLQEELLARMGVGMRLLEMETRLSASLAREEAKATLDSVTGLPNRRALHDRARLELNRARREKQSLSVIMMDIDQFKQINDELGHAAGDDALLRAAEALQKGTRDYDYTGRWGGDEFLVVLPGTPLSQAALVAERIRASVETIHLRAGGADAMALRCSLGVACSSSASHPVELKELLHQADDALYRAKAEGRNRVCIHAPHAER
jgi:two-component system chemotaxis response regulator CheY